MRKFMLAYLTAIILALVPAGGLDAQGNAITGVWQARIGTPSGLGRPGSSVLFLTTLAPDGTFVTQEVVEGSNGIQGAGGTYILTGHYQFQPPGTLQYRVEQSVLCIIVNSCGPGLPPGEEIGALRQIPFRPDANGGAQGDGIYWTRQR